MSFPWNFGFGLMWVGLILPLIQSSPLQENLNRLINLSGNMEELEEEGEQEMGQTPRAGAGVVDVFL